jgi:hypothetical protein
VKVKNTRPKGNVFWKFIDKRDYKNTQTGEILYLKDGGEKEKAGGVLTVLTVNAYYYYYYYWENQLHCSDVHPSSTGRLETG